MNRIKNFLYTTKEHGLPSIPQLIDLTLKVIYDRKRCTDDQIYSVPKYIERYYDIIRQAKDEIREKLGNDYIDKDLRPLGTKGTVLDETEFWICWCAQRLVQSEHNTGEVARNKLNILEHGLDYRKIYRLPGASSAKDYAKAMMYLKKAMQEHPEEYK